MSKTTFSVATMLLSVFACTYPLLAQVKTPLPATRPARARVVPCWEQVGISKSAIEERTAIQRESRSQVEAVCADTSLTPQQKKQRIREIHQQAKERAEALISPQQQEALTARQKVRAANRPPAAPGVHHGGTHTGPCGELLPATHPATPAGNPTREKFPAEQQTVPQ